MATETAPGAEKFIPAGAHTLDELKAAAPGCRGLRALRGRHPDGLRPGRRHGPRGDGRRAARRRRGPAGPAVRRPGRAPAAAGGRRGRHRPGVALHHQRRQALPVRAARQAAASTRPRTASHIEACRPWLVAEFALLRPEVVVVLGATAAKALLGPSFRVTRQRGEVLPWPDVGPAPRRLPRGAAARAARRCRRPSWSPPSTRRPCCAPTTGRRRSTGWSPTSRWSPEVLRRAG